MAADKEQLNSISSQAAGTGIHIRGRFNASIQGTFEGTVALQRSHDDGSNWETVSRDSAGTAATYTAPCSLIVEEPGIKTMYRWNVTAYTSGTVNARISR